MTDVSDIRENTAKSTDLYFGACNSNIANNYAFTTRCSICFLYNCWSQ